MLLLWNKQLSLQNQSVEDDAHPWAMIDRMRHGYQTLRSKITPWHFYRYGIFTILLYPSLFCNLFISRKPINGIDWPARSPDPDPCDFFLWGYLKSKVYCPKPRTLDDLKNNIGLLQPNMIRRSMTLIIGPWRAFKPVEVIYRLYPRTLYTLVINSLYI